MVLADRIGLGGEKEGEEKISRKQNPRFLQNHRLFSIIGSMGVLAYLNAFLDIVDSGGVCKSIHFLL